jgi:starch-binding outer membrane protein, SusD/RagB family
VRRKLPVKKNIYSPVGVESNIELGPDDPRRLFQLPVQVSLAGVDANPR